jgi:hypothetical protein
MTKPHSFAHMGVFESSAPTLEIGQALHPPSALIGLLARFESLGQNGTPRACSSHRDKFCCRMPVSRASGGALTAFFPGWLLNIFCLSQPPSSPHVGLFNLDDYARQSAGSQRRNDGRLSVWLALEVSRARERVTHVPVHLVTDVPV